MEKKLLKHMNLYERNMYKYLKNKSQFSDLDNILIDIYFYIYSKLNRYIFHKVYLNYIEIPITTKCSLRCKECSNLIQFYECGEFIDADKIISDVKILCDAVEGINTLRILGGEPLLHPELKKIVEGILKHKKIENIQIVTNGTMIFKKDIIKLLRNPRTSVDISYYGEKSRKYDEIISQCKKAHIRFSSNKRMMWKELTCLKSNGLTERQLRNAFSNCKLDCISLLKGKIHLCPKSSHGSDLGIFIAHDTDYIDLRKIATKDLSASDLYKLLNKKSIRACNYCYAYRWDEIPNCIPGEQIDKKEAISLLNKAKKRNVRIRNSVGVQERQNYCDFVFARNY